MTNSEIGRAVTLILDALDAKRPATLYVRKQLPTVASVCVTTELPTERFAAHFAKAFRYDGVDFELGELIADLQHAEQQVGRQLAARRRAKRAAA